MNMSNMIHRGLDVLYNGTNNLFDSGLDFGLDCPFYNKLCEALDIGLYYGLSAGLRNNFRTERENQP